MKDGDKLGCLDVIVLEGIMGETNEEALSGVGAEDLAAFASTLAQARKAHGRTRMDRAKAAVKTAAVSPRPGASGSTSRRFVSGPMTLAARGSRGGYEADQDGIEEDFAELEAEDDTET